MYLPLPLPFPFNPPLSPQPCPTVQRNNVIAPMQRPDLFLGGSQLLKPTKGILLYGPPGTGKTMLAKALAKESGARFINIKASSIQSKWFGDTSKLVTAIFTLAWKIQPSIIFIDEVDAMLGKRTGQEHDAVTTLKTEFMQMWDGFVTDSYANVIVLAATNRPNDLDEAVLRRLPLSYEVWNPLPSLSHPLKAPNPSHVQARASSEWHPELPPPPSTASPSSRAGFHRSGCLTAGRGRASSGSSFRTSTAPEGRLAWTRSW